MLSLSSGSWEGSCRSARPPSVPQVTPVSMSMGPHAAAQTRASTSEPRAPRDSPALNAPPGASWSGLTALTPIACWPWTSGPPTLGMCSPSPRTKANRRLWGLLEAFPEKGCVYSMGTTT